MTSRWFPSIVPHELYIIDLDQSSFQFETARICRFPGSEFSVRVKVTTELSLLATWTHREVYNSDIGRVEDCNPKNLLTLGGRFIHPSGFLGSLYAHSRSEFWDRNVPNLAGILEPQRMVHMGTTIFVLGRLGYRWNAHSNDLDTRLEAGVKLKLPVSIDEPPVFRFREKGGGTTPFGVNYGGDELTLSVSLYLKGSLKVEVPYQIERFW